MTDKHEVTVYDRVPATAAVSLAQVEGYLRRTGWVRGPEVGGVVVCWFERDDPEAPYAEVPLMESWRDWAQRAGECVEAIAAAEKRMAAAVLADIAKEEA